MNDNDKIYIDGDFNDSYEARIRRSTGKRKQITPMCDSHKPVMLSYVGWPSEESEYKGLRQIQCEKCKYWFFPEEM